MCDKSWYIIEVNPVQARLPIKNAIYSSRSSRMTLHYQSIPHADNACSNNLKKTAVDSVGRTCSSNAKLFHLATGLDLRSFDATRAHAMLALDSQRCTLSFMCLRFLRHIFQRPLLHTSYFQLSLTMQWEACLVLSSCGAQSQVQPDLTSMRTQRVLFLQCYTKTLFMGCSTALFLNAA